MEEKKDTYSPQDSQEKREEKRRTDYDSSQPSFETLKIPLSGVAEPEKGKSQFLQVADPRTASARRRRETALQTKPKEVETAKATTEIKTRVRIPAVQYEVPVEAMAGSPGVRYVTRRYEYTERDFTVSIPYDPWHYRLLKIEGKVSFAPELKSAQKEVHVIFRMRGREKEYLETLKAQGSALDSFSPGNGTFITENNVEWDFGDISYNSFQLITQNMNGYQNGKWRLDLKFFLVDRTYDFKGFGMLILFFFLFSLVKTYLLK